MFDKFSSQKKKQLISALYETVLYPEKYDELMDAWQDYLHLDSSNQDECPDDKFRNLLNSDHNLDDHFSRVMLMLEQTLWAKKAEKTTTQGAKISISKHPHIMSMDDGAKAMLGDDLSFNKLLDYIDVDGIARLKKALHLLQESENYNYQTFIIITTPTGDTVHFVVNKFIDANKQAVILLQSLSISWSALLADDLAEAYELSAAEITIVKEIASGNSLAKIADKLNRSIFTIRGHAKSVLKKTRSSTQVDLVRLISLMSQVIDFNITRANVSSKVSMLQLPDGRKMQIYSYGPSDGLEVIFLHNMLTGIQEIKRIEGLLYKLGIKMTCPIRASFGSSDPHHFTKEALDIFAADLVFMTQQLDIKKPVLMGYMSGSAYAFAALNHAPDSYCAVVNVAACVPVISKKQFDSMAIRQKSIAYTARYTPSLLPILLRAGINQINSPDAVKFIEALYPNEGLDGQLIKKLNIQNSMLAGLKFSAKQGHHGFAADAYHVTRDWSNLANNISIPVCFIHGADDTVISIKSVHEFSKKQPSMHVHEVKNAGQLIFYQEPEYILSHILKLAQ